MQQKDEKTLYLAKVLGKIINELRIKNKKSSINKFAHEYDLDVGNTSRIENGLIDAKIVTIWKIAEALEIKPSELIKKVEKQLPENWTILNE